MAIRGFQQLQELELKVNWPRFPHRIFLSSITPTTLRKIIFLVPNTDHRTLDQLLDSDVWAFTDEQLCELADQLHATGHHHTLEMELRLAVVEGDPGRYDFTTFFPGFEERGAIAVFCGNRVLHSSVHNR